jgi:antitoxin ParD1/3/4
MSAPAKTLTVAIGDELHKKINAAVESGAYVSEGEVVRHALALWEQRRLLTAMENERLRLAYAEGVSSGEPRDAETVFAELRTWLRDGTSPRRSRIAAE